MEDLEVRPQFNFFSMFWEGFKSMKLGKVLWAIVMIELIILFLILKPLFFSNFLNSKFDSQSEKADYVRQQLIERGK